eukprot:4308435-Pyramimonas_sp.AAC.1
MEPPRPLGGTGGGLQEAALDTRERGRKDERHGAPNVRSAASSTSQRSASAERPAMRETPLV